MILIRRVLPTALIYSGLSLVSIFVVTVHDLGVGYDSGINLQVNGRVPFLRYEARSGICETMGMV